MDSFKRYARKHGLPMSVYLDRHTTYKSPKKLTEWEEVAGIKSFMEKELERLDARSPTESICLLTKQDISTLVGIGHFYCGLTLLHNIP